MAYLDVTGADDKPIRFELPGKPIVIGRHPECAIVLTESTVSRRHLKIYPADDAYFVEDLQSHHGTRVNDEVITLPHRLNDGDKIQVLKSRLVFRESSTTPSESSSVLSDNAAMSSTILTSRSASMPALPGSIGEGQQLRALLDIIRSVGGSLDIDEIFPKVLDSIFRIFPQAAHGCILIAEGPDGTLIPHSIKQTGNAVDEPSPVSLTIAERVMSNGEAILSADAKEDERFAGSQSVQNLRLRSVMCAPLNGTGNKPLGMIQINSEDARRKFQERDLDVLIQVARLVGHTLEHARLHETQLQFARRERDLDAARQVQRHFLPRVRPTVAGYSFFDFYEAAEGVGGDYFDYIDLPDGRIGIALGDVAGKGVTAALMMARLCSDVRYCLATRPTAADSAAALNREIARSVGRSRFVTFALCVLDPHRHQMEVVNAGHMAPLLRRSSDGAVISLAQETSGPPLGIDASLKYGQCLVNLEPGDTILLYTDGVSEAQDADRHMYLTSRVEKTFANCRSAQDAVEQLVVDVRLFTEDQPQYDDICVVSFSRDK